MGWSGKAFLRSYLYKALKLERKGAVQVFAVRRAGQRAVGGGGDPEWRACEQAMETGGGQCACIRVNKKENGRSEIKRELREMCSHLRTLFSE